MTHPLVVRLWLSGAEEPAVLRCTARETMSVPFEASILVESRPELDLDLVLGSEATLRLGSTPAAPHQAWEFSGVCVVAEHVGLANGGASLYSLQIVPALWKLSRRENDRVFSRRSIPEIVSILLAEWGVEASWAIDRAAHPALACRIQYGESDLDFVHRLLDEAGVSYFFEPGDGGPHLRFTDAPLEGEPRHAAALPYIVRGTQPPDVAQVSDAILRREQSRSRVTLQGFDFRRPEHRLLATASARGEPQARAERYRYDPAAFWIDGDAATPGGRAVHSHGARAAERTLAAEVAAASVVSFRTTALDLAPGCIFSMDGHPCAELAPERKLLVVERTIEGGVGVPWVVSARATVAPGRYVPPRDHRKPRIFGVQSAVVVGPPGEEIHTDEHGRSCIRFHWQRDEPGGEHGLWARVNQSWAGAGFGALMLPRVGQEVLVEFFDGDPDQPVITGRVYNGSHPVPHVLPPGRTRSVWRSASTPGGEGHNELAFEDARGREMVHVRAERDLDTWVRHDAVESVGHDRRRRVGLDEAVDIGANQSIAVGASRGATIGASDTVDVGLRHAVTVAPSEPRPEGVGPTRTEVVDRKITLTTGEATITLEGPNITLDAAAGILLRAASDITIAGHANIRVVGSATVRVESEGDDVIVQGAPFVRINPEPRGTDGAGIPPVEVPPGVDLDENVADAESEAWFEPAKPEGFTDRARKGGAWHPLRWGPTFAEFGYFHLGLLARAAGIPPAVLFRQAGKLHEAEHGRSAERGDPGNGLWGGKAPYGNDPGHLELLRKGSAFYERNYR